MRSKLPTRDEVVADMNRSLFAIVRTFDRFRGVFAREQGISVIELRALSRIVESHTLTPKQLAASLDLTTSAVTALVDRMVEGGYVVRVPHPTDRRSLLLNPTDAGEAVMERVRGSFEDLLRSATTDLDDERLDEFRALLAGLVASGEAISA